jgi:tellurite resistance protein TehA-like permease
MSLQYKIFAYAQFLVCSVSLTFVAYDSAAALIALFQGRGLPIAVRMPDVTGTVLVENEPDVTGRIASLILDVSGFTMWQTIQYVAAHGCRVIGILALIAFAFILMRRFMRWEIFSQANTATVTYASAALSALGVSILLLNSQRDKAAKAIFGDESSLYDSGLDMSYGWILVLAPTVLILIFRHGQELHEASHSPRTPDTN